MSERDAGVLTYNVKNKNKDIHAEGGKSQQLIKGHYSLYATASVTIVALINEYVVAISLGLNSIAVTLKPPHSRSLFLHGQIRCCHKPNSHMSHTVC